MRVFDLTHTFKNEIPVYPGDPVPELRHIADLELSGYTLTQIKTGMHTGTHMDGPLHMIENGRSISEIPADRLIGRGVLIDARGRNRLDRELLWGVRLHRKDIVLVLTGYSGRYHDPGYFVDYPEMTESFADVLINTGISIVGMDTAGPDREPFNVHKILLSAEVLIIENLTNLEGLLGIQDFEVYALPMKIEAEAAPVRVVALVREPLTE